MIGESLQRGSTRETLGELPKVQVEASGSQQSDNDNGLLSLMKQNNTPPIDSLALVPVSEISKNTLMPCN